MSKITQAMIQSSSVSFRQTDGTLHTELSSRTFTSLTLLQQISTVWLWLFRPADSQAKACLAALLLKMHGVFVYALATLRGTADLLVMTFSQMGQAESSDSTML